MAEVSRERRSGYSWYTYAPQTALDKYPAWQKKWAPEKDMFACLELGQFDPLFGKNDPQLVRLWPFNGTLKRPFHDSSE